MEPRPPVLELRRVGKTWPGGDTGLDDVSLTVERGELVAVIGESGAGKSTLLAIVHRMTEPTAGEARLSGRPLTEQAPVELRRSIGFVPQSGGLLPHWTVGRNVGLVPRLLGWERDRREERTRELLDLVGLPAARFGSRYPHTLSGGQRQRVALARALAAEPALVLLDEPFGALDALIRRQVSREFRAIQKRLGATAMLVTHDVAEALDLADRVAVLRQGRLEAFATPTELTAEPPRAGVSDYARRLVARGLA